MVQPRLSKEVLTGGRVRMAVNWEQIVKAQMVTEFRAAERTMKREAKRLVPVDSGDLKRSIKSDTTQIGKDLVAAVYATAEYADFVEYGTGRRGAVSHTKGSMRIKKPDDYVHGPKKGMKAQPYLRPAMAIAVRKHFARGR